MAPTTEFEDTGGVNWTSLSNEQTFLETIDTETSAILSVAGMSVQARPMWRLDIGADVAGTLMVSAMVHANEQAAREAALQLARNLAYSVDAGIVSYLTTHRVVVMPNGNPDGFALGQRHNANDVDINRDGFLLSQPESRAIMDVMRQVQPHLFIDCHERPNLDPTIQFEYRRPELLALYPGIKSMGDQLQSVIQTALNGLGVSHAPYPSPGRKSWREYAALNHGLGFLLETSTADPRVTRTGWYLAMLDETRAWHSAQTSALQDMAADSRDYQQSTTHTYRLQTGLVNHPWPEIELPHDLVAYDLPTSIPDDLIQAYSIATNLSQVPLGQQARAVIPILLDEESDDQVVAATRILDDGDTGPPPGTDTDFLPSGTPQPVVQWIACELVTGRKIATLRDVSGGFGRLLGAYTTSSHELPIPAVGGRGLTLAERAEVAVQATTPYRVMLVAIVNDQPAYAGIVTKRQGGTDARLSLGCVSIEGYLARRFVQDHQWENRDDISVIAAGLLGDAGPILGVGSGIGLEIDAPAIGRVRIRHYSRRDRTSVYDRMQELMAIQDGPEWTIELLWGDDTHTWVRKVARIRPRIGVAAAKPAAILSTTGEANVEYVLDEDYAEGKGATYVQAYGVGEGDDQPESDPAIAHDLLAEGWPIVEHHWQPSSTVKRKSTLDLHAQRELQLQQHGALVWSLTARWDATPRLNVNWRLGDDIAWRVTGHRHPPHADGQPGAISKGRCIGWNLDPEAGTVTPLLLDPTSGG